MTQDDRDEKPYRTYRGGGGRRRPIDDELAGLMPAGKGQAAAEAPPSHQAPPAQRSGNGGGADAARPSGNGGRSEAGVAPYRRYAATQEAPAGAERLSPAPDGLPATPPTPRKRKRFHWWYIPLGLLTALVVAAVIFIVVMYPGYRRFDRAVHRANERLPAATKAQLTPDSGMILRNPTTVLLLGTDSKQGEPARSDTIMLMRFDPRSHTINQLSIPRDTRVEVAGHGMTKINEAMFYGGSALAVKTIQQYLGIPVNHVMIVNFQGFPRLVNAVGGIDIYVPKTLTTTAGAEQRVVTFTKGWHHMNGKNAMLYVRIRKVDSDFERAKRQQAFVQALQKKIAQPGNFTKLPDIGVHFMNGVATDLSTWQIMELGWVKWRANDKKTKKFLLAGAPTYIGGIAYVLPPDSAAKQRMIKRFLGK